MSAVWFTLGALCAAIYLKLGSPTESPARNNAERRLHDLVSWY